MTKLSDVIQRGTNAARPAASAVPVGTLYYDTTNSSLGRSNGASWDSVEGTGTSPSGSITASGYTQTTARLLGRTTASTGAIEEITVGSGLSLSAGSLSATGGGSFSSYDTLIAAMSGLVHRWKFEEASGNFADSVGSLTLTKSGTFTYAVAGGPVSGGAGSVTFGASGKGTSSGLGSIPVAGTARTFVLIYKGKDSSSKQCLWSHGVAGTNTWWTAFLNDADANDAKYWSINGFGADLAMGDATSGTNNVGGDAGHHNVETWHMLVAGYDGATSLYQWLDGMTNARRGFALNTSSSGNFTIGLDTAGSNQLGAVTFDDLAIFSRLLAPYEIQQLFNSLVGALP